MNDVIIDRKENQHLKLEILKKYRENNVKKYEILAKQKLLTSVSKSEFIKKKKYHDHKAIFYLIQNYK